jgi:hypothetical protein
MRNNPSCEQRYLRAPSVDAEKPPLFEYVAAPTPASIARVKDVAKQRLLTRNLQCLKRMSVSPGDYN